MKKRHIFLGLALIVGLSACYDLDKEPEGVLSSATPFTSTGEMRNYLDQFYETAVRSQGFSAGGGSGIAGNDVNSDNMAASSVDTRLAGATALSSASALSDYTRIRNVNFFLNNLDNCTEKGSNTYNQYVGEG